MMRSFRLFCILFSFVTVVSVNTQDLIPGSIPGGIPGIGGQALSVELNARIIENGQRVIWNESNTKLAISGSPVGIHLVGSNIVVVAQFTPFIRPNGSVLVAQGQFWLAGDDGTIDYYTSIQTIPMTFGEQIHYFPLGEPQHLNPSIVITITVNPLNEGTRGSDSNRSGGR